MMMRFLTLMLARRARSSAAAATNSRPNRPDMMTNGPPQKFPKNPISNKPLAADGSKPLPFKCIPTPKGLPLIGTAWDMIKSGGSAKIHEYCDKRHKELGPIYKENMGALGDVVCIAKKEYIKIVYSTEGKYPNHFVPETWQIYNQMRGITRGIFFMDGQTWRSVRGHLNNILSPRIAEQYVDVFNDIVDDMLIRFQKMSMTTKDGHVPNLETELYNWSIESLGSMVFGRRLGCVVTDSERSDMHEFVMHVRQIFTESATMAIIPPKTAISLNLPCWQRFVHAADRALEMARGYVQQRWKEIEEAERRGEKVNGILVQLMKIKNTNENEVTNIVADLILAAADTTSHATQWSMYLLSKHPEAQDRILSDLASVVKPGETLTSKHLAQMPYLSNVTKESLRLYPIASFLTRRVSRDICLGGYLIPRGQMVFMSQYTLGRDPELFRDPMKFDPDRWVKKPEGEHNDDRHVLMPFGFGVRSCIGRRVAELKMQLLLARTVQKFRMECVNKKEVGIALRMITTPDQQVKIRLTERNT